MSTICYNMRSTIKLSQVFLDLLEEGIPLLWPSFGMLAFANVLLHQIGLTVHDVLDCVDGCVHVECFLQFCLHGSAHIVFPLLVALLIRHRGAFVDTNYDCVKGNAT